MSSVIEKLTEGIVERDLQKDGASLIKKWEATGLLEGLDNDTVRTNMSRLLENQAKELLRETSTMAAGDVQGFSAVAFPLVRRVFGELIANDLVSVQPMSLPSGLIFFMDFTFNSGRLGDAADTSLYGGGVTGSQITGGLDLGSAPDQETGPYSLNNGYSSPTGSGVITLTSVASGTFGGSGSTTELGGLTQAQFDTVICLSDPDFVSGTTNVYVAKATVSDFTQLNKNNLIGISYGDAGNAAVTGTQRLIRRLTHFSGTAANNYIGGPTATTMYVLFADLAGTASPTDLATGKGTLSLTWPINDKYETADAVGAVQGASSWDLENNVNIPQIDIKVESVAITAMTKKLKAKWSPELGQDLNAYHNLDAEVELTSVLSEQIALEIDQEILTDLVKGSAAGTYFWSRRPGKFVNKKSGVDLTENGANLPSFTGTVSEWYETLIETINEISAQIHRRHLRGGANFVVCSPEVANILEFTAGFRANVGVAENGQAGAQNVGNLSRKMDVYVDPYFQRNIVLVGRKGGSFLESGYVYAPYVPLQVTPTIFGVEDFVPRKGVMTRYGKKMVKADMYGIVVITDLQG